MPLKNFSQKSQKDKQPRRALSISLARLPLNPPLLSLWPKARKVALLGACEPNCRFTCNKVCLSRAQTAERVSLVVVFVDLVVAASERPTICGLKICGRCGGQQQQQQQQLQSLTSASQIEARLYLTEFARRLEFYWSSGRLVALVFFG